MPQQLEKKLLACFRLSHENIMSSQQVCHFEVQQNRKTGIAFKDPMVYSHFRLLFTPDSREATLQNNHKQ